MLKSVFFIFLNQPELLVDVQLMTIIGIMTFLRVSVLVHPPTFFSLLLLCILFLSCILFFSLLLSLKIGHCGGKVHICCPIFCFLLLIHEGHEVILFVANPLLLVIYSIHRSLDYVNVH